MMDANTGKLYESIDDALAAWVPRDDLIELAGGRSAVEKVARAVQQQHATDKRRAKNKAARKSRKRNR